MTLHKYPISTVFVSVIFLIILALVTIQPALADVERGRQLME